MRLLLAPLVAIAAAAPAAAQQRPGYGFYVIVFQVTVDEAGKVSSLKVEHVLDPSLPGTPEEIARRPVNVPVPEAYISAARAFLDTKRYDGSVRTFYTYTFYDPSQPEKVGDEPPTRPRP